MRNHMSALVLTLPVAVSLVLAACGPASDRPSAKPGAKLVGKSGLGAKKCPDPDIRDTKDPCSVAYLPPYKPRVQRDKF